MIIRFYFYLSSLMFHSFVIDNQGASVNKNKYKKSHYNSFGTCKVGCMNVSLKYPSHFSLASLVDKLRHF